MRNLIWAAAALCATLAVESAQPNRPTPIEDGAAGVAPMSARSMPTPPERASWDRPYKVPADSVLNIQVTLAVQELRKQLLQGLAGSAMPSHPVVLHEGSKKVKVPVMIEDKIVIKEWGPVRFEFKPFPPRIEPVF